MESVHHCTLTQTTVYKDREIFMKEKPKMYVVRKYIKAVSAMEAIKKDKNTLVHDVWIDEKWQEKGLPEAIGFDNGISQEE